MFIITVSIFHFVSTATITFLSFDVLQASSEHPLARAILDYAYHYNFFDKLPTVEGATKQSREEILSEWLLEAIEFSALPGRGVQCLIVEKKVLVSLSIGYCSLSLSLSLPLPE